MSTTETETLPDDVSVGLHEIDVTVTVTFRAYANTSPDLSPVHEDMEAKIGAEVADALEYRAVYSADFEGVGSSDVLAAMVEGGSGHAVQVVSVVASVIGDADPTDVQEAIDSTAAWI